MKELVRRFKAADWSARWLFIFDSCTFVALVGGGGIGTVGELFNIEQLQMVGGSIFLTFIMLAIISLMVLLLMGTWNMLKEN